VLFYRVDVWDHFVSGSAYVFGRCCSYCSSNARFMGLTNTLEETHHSHGTVQLWFRGLHCISGSIQHSSLHQRRKRLHLFCRRIPYIDEPRIQSRARRRQHVFPAPPLPHPSSLEHPERVNQPHDTRTPLTAWDIEKGLRAPEWRFLEGERKHENM